MEVGCLCFARSCIIIIIIIIIIIYCTKSRYLDHSGLRERGSGGEGETGKGEEGERVRGGRESDLVRSRHQLGRSRHPLPCGSGPLYN